MKKTMILSRYELDQAVVEYLNRRGEVTTGIARVSVVISNEGGRYELRCVEVEQETDEATV